MAQNKRVRLEPHIETYLLSQAERVLDKPSDAVTGADLTTLVNAVVYEHKLAQSMAKRLPLARLFNWVMSLAPGGSRMVAIAPEQPALKPQEEEPQDFTFDASFADQFEMEDAAA